MFAASKTKGVSAVAANYIEDVFNTWLYPGTDATQTINNGIDMSTYGGLAWFKFRSGSYGASNHQLYDTARGVQKKLATNTTSAEATEATGLTSFNTNGVTFGGDGNINGGGQNYALWCFRQQDKFHKIVTWTGNDATPRTITHNLGSVPGCIIVKKTSGAEDWFVFHRSMGNNGTTQYFCILNSTAAQDTGGYGMEKASSWTSTTFSLVSGGGSALNEAGQTYVAYVFAHNAGGFGLTGTDNVISCGSYTGGTFDGVNYAAVTTTLGFEPQWVLVKETTGNNAWFVFDNMRGIATGGVDARLSPNSANQEYSSNWIDLTSTGFTATASDGSSGINNGSSNTYIYIAIRRGPMKVPTDGTKVFSPNQTSATTGTAITTGFPVDWQLLGINGGNVYNQRSSTRLTGVNTDGTSNSQYLVTSNTNAEAATGSLTLNWNNTGFQVPSLNSGSPTIFWNFRRAPGFFDEVCYTGTGSTTAYTHNLGVAPELMIVKSRSSGVYNWEVWSVLTPVTAPYGHDTLKLNLTNAAGATGYFPTDPTATEFTVSNNNQVNASGGTYVNYLFASCPGVSKVGSYTGNGTTQTINCGFAGGARFVLIKRTDSTGDWYVYDTARGMTVLTDPYLLLNSTAAESATLGSVITTSVGFIVDATILAAVNTNGASYIFLAIS